jgi:hypothetical protein
VTKMPRHAQLSILVEPVIVARSLDFAAGVVKVPLAPEVAENHTKARIGGAYEPNRTVSQGSVDAPVHVLMVISPTSPVTAAPRSPPEKPASATVLATLTSRSASSAAQEATETPAQTAQEAAHGDQQAVRLQAARTHKAQNPSPTGTGRLVKVTA